VAPAEQLLVEDPGAGAMLGPVAAFGLLFLLPGQYDAVFVVSLCVALLGIAVLVIFVPSQSQSAVAQASTTSTRQPPVALSAAVRLLKRRPFGRLVIGGTLLGLATISDAFLYLSIQQRMQFNVGFFPLLFVITAAAYMLFAVPAGAVADRVGRGKVFLGGYALLLCVYSILLHESLGWGLLIAYLALHGA
jgi:Na+/melibiose symporter-like transporter